MAKYTYKNPLYKTPTYRAWDGLRQRCTNPNNDSYFNYGGIGISFDPNWKLFENFVADMGVCPANCSIHRIDSDKDYCKENCIWINKRDHAKLHARFGKGRDRGARDLDRLLINLATLVSRVSE